MYFLMIFVNWSRKVRSITEISWLRFAAIPCIDKMSLFILKCLSLKSIMPRRWKLSQDLPEKTLGGVILVKDSCSGEPGWNFTKKRIYKVLFILENFWKWMTFDSSFWTTSNSSFWRISISHHRNFFQLLFFIMQH